MLGALGRVLLLLTGLGIKPNVWKVKPVGKKCISDVGYVIGYGCLRYVTTMRIQEMQQEENRNTIVQGGHDANLIDRGEIFHN